MDSKIKPLIIFAGNHAQAKEFARQNALPLRQWMFLDHYSKLDGRYRDHYYIKIGSYYKREDFERIQQMLKVHRCKEIIME